MATFRHMQTGETIKREYNNLYAMAPAKIHPGLIEAGLATPASNNLLDVD